MEVSITVGWWAVPLAITVASFIAAYKLAAEPDQCGYFPDFGAAISLAANIAFAIIVSLVAWLVWALVG